MWRHVTVTVEDDGFWPLEIVASTTEAATAVDSWSILV